MMSFQLFIKIMEEGGPMMWVIFACAVLALFVCLEKVFQFHRDEINVRELLRGLINVLKRPRRSGDADDGLREALTLCDEPSSPASRLVRAAILAYRSGDADLRQAVDDAALEELPKLERHINLLGTLGFVLPLMGFLGTVIGMLRVFEPLKNSENFSADIGGAVAMALITTAAGLSVAIPCHLGYNYLVARVNAITLDMEKAAFEITSFLERQRSAAPAPAPAPETKA